MTLHENTHKSREAEAPRDQVIHKNTKTNTNEKKTDKKKNVRIKINKYKQ